MTCGTAGEVVWFSEGVDSILRMTPMAVLISSAVGGDGAFVCFDILSSWSVRNIEGAVEGVIGRRGKWNECRHMHGHLQALYTL